jgi:SAM-dependent methyltransferase
MDILSRAKIPFPHPIINVLAEDLGLIWPAQTFDLIVCKNALGEFMDPVQAVNQMARLLKPGGTLVIDFEETLEETRAPFEMWKSRAADGVLAFDRGNETKVLSRVGDLELEFVAGEDKTKRRFKMRRPKSGLVLVR